MKLMSWRQIGSCVLAIACVVTWAAPNSWALRQTGLEESPNQRNSLKTALLQPEVPAGNRGSFSKGLYVPDRQPADLVGLEEPPVVAGRVDLSRVSGVPMVFYPDRAQVEFLEQGIRPQELVLDQGGRVIAREYQDVYIPRDAEPRSRNELQYNLLVVAPWDPQNRISAEEFVRNYDRFVVPAPPGGASGGGGSSGLAYGVLYGRGYLFVQIPNPDNPTLTQEIYRVQLREGDRGLLPALPAGGRIFVVNPLLDRPLVLESVGRPPAQVPPGGNLPPRRRSARVLGVSDNRPPRFLVPTSENPPRPGEQNRQAPPEGTVSPFAQVQPDLNQPVPPVQTVQPGPGPNFGFNPQVPIYPLIRQPELSIFNRPEIPPTALFQQAFIPVVPGPIPPGGSLGAGGLEEPTISPFIAPVTDHQGPIAIVGTLGGTSIAFQAAIPQGLLSERAANVTLTKPDKSDTAEGIAGRVVDTIGRVIDQFGRNQIAFVQFTAPERSVNIPAFKDLSIQQLVEQRLAQEYPRPAALGPIPVTVIPEGTGGAKGETSIFGSQPGAKGLLFVNAGDEIRTRFIDLNGEPFIGDERINFLHNEGPLHLVFNGNPANPDYRYIALETKGRQPDVVSRVLPDGRSNPLFGGQDLEARTSGPNIARYAIQLAQSGQFPEPVVSELRALTPKQDLSEITTKELGVAARQGNPLALKAIQDRARELGIGLTVFIVESHRNFPGFTFPEHIVIGSGVAQIGEIFLQAVLEGFRERLQRYQREEGIVPDRGIEEFVGRVELSKIKDDTVRELLAGLPTQAQVDQHTQRLAQAGVRSLVEFAPGAGLFTVGERLGIFSTSSLSGLANQAANLRAQGIDLESIGYFTDLQNEPLATGQIHRLSGEQIRFTPLANLQLGPAQVVRVAAETIVQEQPAAKSVELRLAQSRSGGLTLLVVPLTVGLQQPAGTIPEALYRSGVGQAPARFIFRPENAGLALLVPKGKERDVRIIVSRPEQAQYL